MTRTILFGLAGLSLLTGLVVFAQPGNVNWTINGGENNIRFSPLTQVNKSNVKSLQVAWTYESGDALQGLGDAKQSRSSSTECCTRPRRR